jgi:cell division transport system permease protein
MFDFSMFIVGEAFVALRRNLAMAFAGVSTGAIALFLLGLLGFAFQTASEYAQTVPTMFDMRVFLNDHTERAAIEQTIADVRAIPGVKSVALIPRDKAWEKMKREQPELTKNLDNPLPDQLKVLVNDLRLGDPIAQRIQALPTVVPDDGVHYLREEQRAVIAVLDAFKVLGPTLFALLVVATGILIYNTIRLTVMSRRLEIRIMQLVGASAGAIRIPFLIEGTLQGAAAGLSAGFLLLLSARLLSRQMSLNALPATYPIGFAVSVMVLTGGCYGLICSLLAVRVPLQYR